MLITVYTYYAVFCFITGYTINLPIGALVYADIMWLSVDNKPNITVGTKYHGNIYYMSEIHSNQFI